MKTLFIATGPIEWASCRMRCYWPARYMGAEVVTMSELAKQESVDADAVVFQKAFSVPHAQAARERGARVFWDLCDPVYWWQPNESREALQHVDGVVCSSTSLRCDFAQWCNHSVPSYVIPDRLELPHFPMRKQHADTRPVRFIWFGLSNNRLAIFGALANLERLTANGYPIELTICDDAPGNEWKITDAFPMLYTRWSLERENQIVAAHDVALLPPYPGPWGEVKSNNKQLTAWACGLAVTSGINYDNLVKLMDANNRKANADAGFKAVEDLYQVEQSARDWEALCS